jgi:xylan 1,4-beta-xylosidase
MNKPKQLTKQQVDEIKKFDDGSPVSKENLRVDSSGVFSKELDIRENDVFLFNLIKL